ncbi:DUF885 domain-containing protein [Ideonella alba]|uniref:DUF885 domain-containing protein n=1 Tax=Ideonella alba TaxID=2824118 RepID=A0A940Y5B5_9BURK|nr:DUF885 domain-containing protein [Ideonella alba]MBQ0930052.1 DUF885 domain-containing protein [Ideonella alba]
MLMITRPHRLHWRGWLCAALLGLAATLAQAASASRELQRLFDEHWRWQMRHQPEWASSLGVVEAGERWDDHSPAALDAADAHERQLMQRLQRIKPQQLRGEERLSWEIFHHDLALAIEQQRHPVLRTLVLSGVAGPHLALSGVLQDMPMTSEADARRVLARLAAWPARVDQDLALARDGLKRGWVSHRASLQRLLDQLDGQLALPPRQQPAFEPMARLLAAGPEVMVTPARREALAAEAEALIVQRIAPALRTLRRAVAEELLPAAPANGSLSLRPGGAEVYRLLVREQTTTDLNPTQIHAIGLGEVQRLRAEMDALRASTGFAGDFDAFVRFLYTDPRFFHRSAEALLDGYRSLAKRVDPALPRLFATLPRQPYGIRAIPPDQGAGMADNYSGGSPDNSRPGWFNTNVVALDQRPIWQMEALFLHETVPGHHLQGARAQELTQLPEWRRHAWHVAYGEGWALYAEGLGESLGLYQDPYSRFGRLSYEAWRAARLVVDTGIHALGWSREQAIDYISGCCGMGREEMAAEVDRYIAWPAQALGYKLGQMRILALREQARQALGERFDIRRFHQAVLDHGSVPLPVLERIVADWIRSQRP